MTTKNKKKLDPKKEVFVETGDKMIIDPMEYDIPKNRAEMIREAFDHFADQINEYEEDFVDILRAAGDKPTKAVAKKAKTLRLRYVKIRTAADKAHKEQKASILTITRAIDGIRNQIKFSVEDKEESLKKIEEYEAIQEQKRRDKLQAKRVKELSQYVDDAESIPLWDMTEDVWDNYLNGAKMKHEAKIAEEKKRKEEEERQAKAKEIHKLRFEKIRPYIQHVDKDISDLSEFSNNAFLKLYNEAIAAQKKIDDEKAEREAKLKKSLDLRDKRIKESEYNLSSLLTFEEIDQIGHMSDEDYAELIKSVAERDNERKAFEALKGERMAAISPYLSDAQYTDAESMDQVMSAIASKNQTYWDEFLAQVKREAENNRKLAEELKARENSAESERNAQAANERLIKAQQSEKIGEAESSYRKVFSSEMPNNFDELPLKEQMTAWVQDFKIRSFPGQKNDTADEIASLFLRFKVHSIKLINNHED